MNNRRVYERDTDALFLRLLRNDRSFLDHFTTLAVGAAWPALPSVAGQQKHLGSSGSIDIVIRYPDGPLLLVENKIDAAYSVTSEGLGQPQRYGASVSAYLQAGIKACSVVLAPSAYLSASRAAAMFDSQVAYEELLSALQPADRELLYEAIAQASAPYEPIPNLATGDFFLGMRDFIATRYPTLAMKRDPNANSVRPDDSRTIYFDVNLTLKSYSGVPRPRMSLQCCDSAAPSASVKIMLGGMAKLANRLSPPEALADIGGYLRPAGRSLGFVINTPKLDTQRSIERQVENVMEGLDAASRLQRWWNESARTLREWVSAASN